MPALRKQRALLVMLEFFGWEQARPWSSSAQFAVEEGLRAQGVECTVLPMIGGTPSSSPLSWAYHAREMLKGETFDQVWIWLVHAEYDAAFWEWVGTIAPIRVGVVPESMTYDAELCKIDERYAHRAAVVEEQIQHCTHVLAVDEVDVPRINAKVPGKAIWWPMAAPGRVLSAEITRPEHQITVFHGVIYLTRAHWLQPLPLKGRLYFAPPPDTGSSLPKKFEEVNLSSRIYLEHSTPRDAFYMTRHAAMLRAVRAEIFDQWMAELRKWGAVANIPSMGRQYGTRVFESMAAGRTVISWRIPERPATNALFEHGREILHFNPETPEEFLEALDLVRNNPDYVNTIARNALEKVRELHTIERRAGEILEWLNSGTVPYYSEEKALCA